MDLAVRPAALLRRHFLRPELDPNAAEWYNYYSPPPQESLHSEGLLTWLRRSLWALFQLLFLLCLSALSYAVLYHNCMPATAAVRPLFFDYFTGGGLGGATRTTTRESAVQHRRVSLFRQLQTEASDYQSRRGVSRRPVPTATVDLWAPHDRAWPPVACSSSDDIFPPPPLAEEKIITRRRSPLLRPHQAYYVEVTLVLPDSPLNQNAGMFGVVTELYAPAAVVEAAACRADRDPGRAEAAEAEEGSTFTATKTTTTTSGGTRLVSVSRRSLRFPYRSRWIAVLGKIIALLPLLLGSVHETVTVTDLVFRHYIDSASQPVVRLIFYFPDERVFPPERR